LERHQFPIPCGFGILLLEPGCNGVEIRLRLGNRDTILQSAYDEVKYETVRLLAISAEIARGAYSSAPFG
jgi:hypothetical protein